MQWNYRTITISIRHQFQLESSHCGTMCRWICFNRSDGIYHLGFFNGFTAKCLFFVWMACRTMVLTCHMSSLCCEFWKIPPKLFEQTALYVFIPWCKARWANWFWQPSSSSKGPVTKFIIPTEIGCALCNECKPYSVWPGIDFFVTGLLNHCVSAVCARAVCRWAIQSNCGLQNMQKRQFSYWHYTEQSRQFRKIFAAVTKFPATVCCAVSKFDALSGFRWVFDWRTKFLILIASVLRTFEWTLSRWLGMVRMRIPAAIFILVVINTLFLSMAKESFCYFC